MKSIIQRHNQGRVKWGVVESSSDLVTFGSFDRKWDGHCRKLVLNTDISWEAAVEAA